MVVNPSVPAKTLPEFIAYAKANPGKINMASPGSGSTPHVNGELFKVMTGTNMVHVPYRSAAAVMTDLLSGQVQLYFGTTASSLEYVRTGKLRALAVTIERRLDALPDIPTVAEFVPGYEASGWFGVGAPRNTPAEIVDKLNKEINAGLADPKMKARLADLGGIPLDGLTQPTSASSSSKRPRSGARWSSCPAPRRSDRPSRSSVRCAASHGSMKHVELVDHMA